MTSLITGVCVTTNEKINIANKKFINGPKNITPILAISGLLLKALASKDASSSPVSLQKPPKGIALKE
ncbi:hypothetical protein SDC9_135264 [bioreactor metagenome]|uniref:Uncharacterized protein n=1 Tax=bioreactor metagenome TaxID=1076179 RepID=A0A645DH65_9ZZZZ